MANSELRAALEQRLSALAIPTEVVEHPEVSAPARALGPNGVGSAAGEAKV